MSSSTLHAQEEEWRRWLLRHSRLLREEYADWSQGKPDIEWAVASPEVRTALYALSSAPACTLFGTTSFPLYALLRAHSTGSLVPALFSPEVSCATLEALAELCDFWDMPTVWSRAARAEAEVRISRTDGPLLAPLKRDVLQRVLRFENPAAVRRLLENRRGFPTSWAGDSEAVLWDKLLFCLTPRGEAMPMNCFLVEIFASMGDMEGLQWAFGRDKARSDAQRALPPPVDGGLPINALSVQCEALMQWLSEHGCPWDDAAAPRQSVLQLRNLLGEIERTTYDMDRSSDPPMMWRWRTESCSAAISQGQLPALQWLYRELHSDWDARYDVQSVSVGSPGDYYPSVTEVTDEAALHGQLPILQWALSAGLPLKDTATFFTTVGGHLQVLKWLASQGAPLHDQICTGAADFGHLAILQWARAQEPPCPWDEDLCTNAACHGELAILQWARAQEPPCPWEEAILTTETYYEGHLDVLQWLVAQGCPWDRDTACKRAVELVHLPMLQWAFQQGCPWTAQCTALLSIDTNTIDRVKIKEWAQEQGLINVNM